MAKTFNIIRPLETVLAEGLQRICEAMRGKFPSAPAVDMVHPEKMIDPIVRLLEERTNMVNELQAEIQSLVTENRRLADEVFQLLQERKYGPGSRKRPYEHPFPSDTKLSPWEKDIHKRWDEKNEDRWNEQKYFGDKDE